MNKNFSLITKNGYAVEFIARYFISKSIDTRIYTISQFEEYIDVARGTIQNSIKILTESNAVEIKSRGQLGSYLVSKDTKKLLSFAGIDFLIGVMPLPYSKIYEGLSTALLQTMENNLNIPVNMAYMRGAERRIQMVIDERYDFAVISKFAALTYLENSKDINVILELEPGSFLSGHSLMFSKPHLNEIEDGMRIGIDNDSIDQSYLTKKVCAGKNVEFVEISYTQLLEKLELNEIDATVWNDDEADTRLQNIHSVPLEIEHNDNTKAVIIIKKERTELNTILQEIIDTKKVELVQNNVVKGNLIPSY